MPTPAKSQGGIQLVTPLASRTKILIATLHKNAKPKSTGWCALYCRIALNKAGYIVNAPKHDRGAQEPSWACEYGQSLIDAGFFVVNIPHRVTGIPVTGDVAVIQANSKKPYGHMCIFDGKIWISDFKQLDMWGGATMRKEKPRYDIYRYVK